MTDETYPPEPSLAQILELEEKVWQALLTGDSALDEHMLSADFLGVYPSGFAGRDVHTSQLDSGSSMSDHRLSEEKLRIVGPEAVLLSYRADYLASDSANWDTMLISSLWEWREGRWINTFSQDTPLKQ